MLTKEEVIILRTIFLEFGDEDLQQKRLEFPYENMEVEGLEGAKSSTRKANLGLLINDLKGFGVPEIDSIVFEFYLMEGSIDGESNIPNAERLVIVKGKQKGGNWDDEDREDRIETRDRWIFLKGISENDFFINMRMGLYYKGLDDYVKTVKHFEEAHKIYCKTFEDTINNAATNLNQFSVQFYDFDNKAFKESYSPEKHGSLPEIKLPPQLLVSLEESPSFHLAEVYLDEANKFFTDYQSSRDISILDIAEENYAKAVYWLEESSKWYGATNYDQDIDNPIVSNVKAFGVICFPVSPYKRNCYWEINYTTSKNQLRRIEEEKFVSTIKMLERPDPAFIEVEVSKVISQERERRKLVEEELRKKTEKLKRFEAIIPDPESIPLRLKVEIKLFAIFNESQEVLFWVDKHFDWKGLNYLQDGEVAGKIRSIRILTGPVNIDERFKSTFPKLKEEMRSKTTTIDIRVITKEHVLGKMHARWLITDQNSYKVPPVGSMKQRQVDTINLEEDKKNPLNYFNEWWLGGVDILTGDWKEIQNIRDKMVKRNR